MFLNKLTYPLILGGVTCCRICLSSPAPALAADYEVKPVLDQCQMRWQMLMVNR